VGAPKLAVIGFCALVSTTGCRWVFGLDNAGPMDAAPAIDAAIDGSHNGECFTTGLTCAGTAVAVSCGNTCWASCSEPVTEMVANSRCRAWGDQLATLRTSGDQTCLRQTVVPTGDVWIALLQSASASTPSMSWSWNGDMVTPTFTNWTGGQPDDGDTVESGSEQCAYIANGVSTWSDTPCTATYPFACTRRIDN
jgi:hypothetical protein